MTVMRCPKCGEKMVEVRGRRFSLRSGKTLIVVREYICRKGCVLN